MIPALGPEALLIFPQKMPVTGHEIIKVRLWEKRLALSTARPFRAAFLYTLRLNQRTRL